MYKYRDTVWNGDQEATIAAVYNLDQALGNAME